MRTTPDLWLGLQARYDLESVSAEHKARIEKEARPIQAELPDPETSQTIKERLYGMVQRFR